jgi:hypothetical protein
MGEFEHDESIKNSPDDRYRLYIDESGDHVFRQLETEAHRYLCLLGCWFRASEYRAFHGALEEFKQKHIPHNPDEPVILHREDIVNRRGPFWRLRDPAIAKVFDSDLLNLIEATEFKVVAVVIDKASLQQDYATPSHPYHLGMGFMLQRYCGYLNHINRQGDVMAESRGGKENRLLMASYEWCYHRGVWRYTSAESIQQALTTHKLKIKQKASNIAGLQLADLLGHPVKKAILIDAGHSEEALAPFATRVLDAIEGKFNRQLYKGDVSGYGKVFFPRLK